jgi:hypothetical protein
VWTNPSLVISLISIYVPELRFKPKEAKAPQALDDKFENYSEGTIGWGGIAIIKGEG